MNLELRDELATRIAAALADSTLSPREIAIRAYATADALLSERTQVVRPDLEDSHLFDGDLEAAVDPGPPHDPRWEIEPRWSEADRALRDQAVARHDEDTARKNGPGLAATRPTDRDDDREAETG